MESDDVPRKTSKVLVRKPGLILPELSYQIVGALYDVYNELGFGHQERIYQRAIADTFRSRSIPFVEQYEVPVHFHQKKLGTYRLDFLIQDAVILEIKQGNYFRPSNIKQTLSYLKSLNKQLAILANFTRSGVSFRRIVNAQEAHS
ncbi:GxxExxY protein [Candidatus Uhrbacteria bacterium]|nr:GxxExxY protein [Candidatus Uhrbacteria bacterium]MBD3284132.1 GxxExxY protein [Candidatus Uhrbacteria bacterium]